RRLECVDRLPRGELHETTLRGAALHSLIHNRCVEAAFQDLADRRVPASELKYEKPIGNDALSNPRGLRLREDILDAVGDLTTVTSSTDNRRQWGRFSRSSPPLTLNFRLPIDCDMVEPVFGLCREQCPLPAGAHFRSTKGAPSP